MENAENPIEKNIVLNFHYQRVYIFGPNLSSVNLSDPIILFYINKAFRKGGKKNQDTGFANKK